MVRHFVRLAALEHAPRYLRFLGMLTLPSGRPAKRCQSLVLQSLLEKGAHPSRTEPATVPLLSSNREWSVRRHTHRL